VVVLIIFILLAYAQKLEECRHGRLLKSPVALWVTQPFKLALSKIEKSRPGRGATRCWRYSNPFLRNHDKLGPLPLPNGDSFEPLDSVVLALAEFLQTPPSEQIH
jgi:hypothetical protein